MHKRAGHVAEHRRQIDLLLVMPTDCRARLLPDHRIRFEADVDLVPPTNATDLVAALVRFVLALDPYLDRLEAAGAGWAVGRAKT